MRPSNTFTYYLSWGLKIILIGLFIFSTFTSQFPLNIAILMAVFLSFAPSFFARSFKIHFPVEIEAVVTFALLLDSIGRVFRLYHTDLYWWFDIVTHFLGTLTISLVAFYLMFAFLFLRKIKMPYWVFGLFTFAIAMAIGALWEIGEFYFDRVTGFNSYFNESNSIRDMLFDAGGALLISIAGSLYLKRRVTHWWTSLLKG